MRATETVTIRRHFELPLEAIEVNFPVETSSQLLSVSVYAPRPDARRPTPAAPSSLTFVHRSRARYRRAGRTGLRKDTSRAQSDPKLNSSSQLSAWAQRLAQTGPARNRGVAPDELGSFPRTTVSGHQTFVWAGKKSSNCRPRLKLPRAGLDMGRFTSCHELNRDAFHGSCMKKLPCKCLEKDIRAV